MRRRGGTPGVFLIALGLYFLLTNNGYVQNQYFLLFLGAAFIVAYILGGRRVGVLLAGCIITVTGFYDLLRDTALPDNGGGIYLMMLGMAFLLVFGVHTVNQPDSAGRRFWPLYPGGILLALGALSFAGVDYGFGEWSNLFWPVAMIAGGCLLFLRGQRPQ